MKFLKLLLAPNLKNVVVALNFSGMLRIDAIKILMKKQGTRKFSEGVLPCHLPGQAVLCISSGRPTRTPFSGFASGSGSGRGNSYSGSVSQSGNYYVVPIFATLIRADGSTIELGEVSSFAFAGQINSSGSSSGLFHVGFSSSSSTSSVNSPDAAIGAAAIKAVMKLLDPVWWRKKMFDPTTNAQWIPGASAELAAAFGK
jgi:hypothetical protein